LVPSPGISKRRKKLTICVVDLYFLKASVDVLQQYSLPKMGLRRAIHLIIDLLPKDKNTTSALPPLSCRRLLSASSNSEVFKILVKSWQLPAPHL
jgi:hypothetical protein